MARPNQWIVQLHKAWRPALTRPKINSNNKVKVDIKGALERLQMYFRHLLQDHNRDCSSGQTGFRKEASSGFLQSTDYKYLVVSILLHRCKTLTLQIDTKRYWHSTSSDLRGYSDPRTKTLKTRATSSRNRESAQVCLVHPGNPAQHPKYHGSGTEG